MKVLFIQKMLGQEMMGLMYLSRALKDAGHEVQCLFLPCKGDLLTEVKRFGPDLLCYGMTTGIHRYYRDVNRHIRERYDAFSVFGGIFPTFVPEIVEDPHIDAVCIGEGEPAIVELANRLERGEPLDDIQNFHIKFDGKLHKNGVRPLVQNLDTLGFPDRSVLYHEPIYGQSKYKVFMTSRGCVARCHYCFHSGYGKTYDSSPGRYLRRRSPEHVITEIEDVRSKYYMKFVHFTDDMFNFDRNWQEKFLALYREQIGMPFSAIFMIDWTTPDLLKLYKDAGCVNIRLAFETASDDIKKDLNRFKSTPSANQMTAADMVQQAGIRLTTLNMVGMPGGTIQNEINTLKMNLLANPMQVLVNFIHPYPGTQMDPIIEAAGLKRLPYDEFDPKATRWSPINLPEREKVENLHHLFPLVVKFPSLIGAIPWLIRARASWVRKIYLGFFGLCMDWQFAELLHTSKSRFVRPFAIGAELLVRLGQRIKGFTKQALFSLRNPIRA